MEDNWDDCSEGRGKDDSGVIKLFWCSAVGSYV